MLTRKESSNLYRNKDQYFLSTAALFEGEFSIDWIEELTNSRASRVLGAMEKGVQKGWIERKDPCNFYFKDHREQQRLQTYLSREEKESMRRKILQLLLKELPERGKNAIAFTPYLFGTTNDLEGCRLLIEAGDIHRKSFHINEAFQCYKKVLDDLLNRSGEGLDPLFIDAAIKISKISSARHDTEKILFFLRCAIKRAIKLNKAGSLSLLKMHLAKNEWLLSRHKKAMRHFEEGASIAARLKEPKLLRAVNNFNIFLHYWRGCFRDVIRVYEESILDTEKYPNGMVPPWAGLIVGRCYSHTGQVSQGLGMLDTIRNDCLQRGDQYTAAHALYQMGATMIEIGQMKEALDYIENSMKEVHVEENSLLCMYGKLTLAYLYCLKSDEKKSVYYLRKYLQYSRQVNVSQTIYAYFMEISWGVTQKRLPTIPGISLQNEVKRMKMVDNIFMNGLAYRYQSLLQRRRGESHKKIINSLHLSQKLLEQSGHQVELANSQFELAREYLLVGNEAKATETLLRVSMPPSPFHQIIPDDLAPLIKNPPRGEKLLTEILKLGEEMVTIRDNKSLVQKIISAGNLITGAERGAIFLFDENSKPRRIFLKASQNLTSEQINHPSFVSSIKMIEKVALSGKGHLGTESVENAGSHPSENIRSRICVPLVLRGKVIGVLYHDNRLLSGVFKESDLNLLAYFAAQAAIALDNANAYGEIQLLNQKLKEENLYYEEQHIQTFHFEDIVGQSPAIMKVLEQLDQVAQMETTVLILGETGVGKELVARAIHRHSPRRGKPFIRVLCNALPESLIPSELFGHERGAFTGAIQTRIGRFELANEGTIFLDEIGDLPLEIQVRLLRVLESKEFERVGGNETIRSDFRLIAATNRDIDLAVKNGKFRPDLYFRLNVFPFYVPPLRERKEDIPLLAHFFLKIYADKMGKTFVGISKPEMNKLIQYKWPGNVRELENIIERGSILSLGPFFRVPELGGSFVSNNSFPKEDMSLSANERRHILWALQTTGWKVRGQGGASELLKVHHSTLGFRMKKLGIQRPPEFSRKKIGSSPNRVDRSWAL